MTYWAREHEHNLRRIGDIIRELEHAREDIIPALISDLADDAYDQTEDARARLIEAKHAIGEAAYALEKAKEQLPEPQFRPNMPMLYPTADEVMREDF